MLQKANRTQVFVLSNTVFEILFNILSKLEKYILNSCQFDHLIPTSRIKVLNPIRFSTPNAKVTSDMYQTLQKKVDMKNVKIEMYKSVCSGLNPVSWISTISFRRIPPVPQPLAEQSVFKVNAIHAEYTVWIKLETPHTDSVTNDLAL